MNKLQNFFSGNTSKGNVSQNKSDAKQFVNPVSAQVSKETMERFVKEIDEVDVGDTGFSREKP